MTNIILFVVWIIASAHNDVLIEERLGQIDYFSGWKIWLPDFLNRVFLGAILFIYWEWIFVNIYSLITKTKPNNWL